jgi:hypothetical protein
MTGQIFFYSKGHLALMRSLIFVGEILSITGITLRETEYSSPSHIPIKLPGT